MIFVDENVEDFFKRHEEDDSIFVMRKFDNTYSAIPGTTYRADKINDSIDTVGGIRIAERERTHYYGGKSFHDEITERKKMYAELDKLIDFGNQDRLPQKQSESKFNFEGFWKQKIGALIGLGTKEEEQKMPSQRINLNDAASGSYQDDNGRNIVERWSVLFEGDPQFLEVNLSVNIFSEQSLK